MDARARWQNALPVALARPWHLWRARGHGSTSENVSPALNDLERTAERLHPWSHLVRRPEVEKRHAVLILADHFFETRGHFDSATGAQATLKYRKLPTVSVPLDDGQDAAPAFAVGDVVRDDEDAFFRHDESARGVVGNTWDLAQQVTREQAALHDNDAAHADAITEDRVHGFLVQVVGWAMALHLRPTLVLDALEMALEQRRP